MLKNSACGTRTDVDVSNCPSNALTRMDLDLLIFLGDVAFASLLIDACLPFRMRGGDDAFVIVVVVAPGLIVDSMCKDY